MGSTHLVASFEEHPSEHSSTQIPMFGLGLPRLSVVQLFQLAAVCLAHTPKTLSLFFLLNYVQKLCLVYASSRANVLTFHCIRLRPKFAFLTFTCLVSWLDDDDFDGDADHCYASGAEVWLFAFNLCFNHAQIIIMPQMEQKSWQRTVSYLLLMKNNPTPQSAPSCRNKRANPLFSCKRWGWCRWWWWWWWSRW